MAKDCLYCGLQFSDTTQFCPNCGRPAESGFSIRPLQEAELQRLCREVKEKDELIRQLALTRTREGEAFRAVAHSTDRRDHYDSDGRRGDCPLEELKEGGYADRSTQPVREPSFLAKHPCGTDGAYQGVVRKLAGSPT